MIFSLLHWNNYFDANVYCDCGPEVFSKAINNILRNWNQFRTVQKRYSEVSILSLCLLHILIPTYPKKINLCIVVLLRSCTWKPPFCLLDQDPCEAWTVMQLYNTLFLHILIVSIHWYSYCYSLIHTTHRTNYDRKNYIIAEMVISKDIKNLYWISTGKSEQLIFVSFFFFIFLFV